jgi:hypothetical protein
MNNKNYALTLMFRALTVVVISTSNVSSTTYYCSIYVDSEACSAANNKTDVDCGCYWTGTYPYQSCGGTCTTPDESDAHTPAPSPSKRR